MDEKTVRILEEIHKSIAAQVEVGRQNAKSIEKTNENLTSLYYSVNNLSDKTVVIASEVKESRDFYGNLLKWLIIALTTSVIALAGANRVSELLIS